MRSVCVDPVEAGGLGVVLEVYLLDFRRKENILSRRSKINI
jgi:hypothetical protein